MKTIDVETPIAELEFTVLDTETTGVNPREGHQIIEVGMAKYSGGRIVDTFDRLIRPTRPLSAEALAVHKITPEQLDGAPPMAESVDDIRGFIGETVITAHNAQFDMTFIHTALAGLGEPLLENWTIDTIHLSSALWPDMQCHCLKCMALRLDLPHQGTHRALEDVYATVDLLDRILAEMEKRGKTTLDDLEPLSMSFTWGEGDAYRRLVGSLNCAIRKGFLVHLFYYDREACAFTKTTVTPVKVEKGELLARVPGGEEESRFDLLGISKVLSQPGPEAGAGPGHCTVST